MLYRSTNATEGSDVVSGTVLVHALGYLGGGKRPFVDYAVGTQGLGDQCGPTNQMAVGSETDAGIIDGMLLQGWAVAVTDYERLGTPGQHTYAVGRSLGHAVLTVQVPSARLVATERLIDSYAAEWGFPHDAVVGWRTGAERRVSSDRDYSTHVFTPDSVGFVHVEF